MKIANKISVSFFMVGLIITSIAAPLFYMVSKSNLQNAIFAHLATTAQSRSTHIDTLLTEEEEAVLQFAQSVVVRDFLKAKETDADYGEKLDKVMERLARTAAIRGNVEEINVFNKEGRIIASSNRGSIGTDMSGDIPLQKAKEGLYIKDVYFPEDTGAAEVAAFAPVVNYKTQELLGLIAARINLADLYKILSDRTGLGKTGEIYLVNKEMYIISPSRFIKNAVLKLKVNTKNIRMALKDIKKYGREPHEHVPLVFKDYRGVMVLGVHDHISEMDWILAAEIDEKEALAPLFEISLMLLIIMILAPVIAGMSGFFVARAITRPIRKLHDGVEIVGTGNLDYKVGTDAKDEIGQFSRAFDRMTENLKKTTASRDEMQREVAERRRAEEKFRDLTETTTDWIWEVDKEGVYTYASPKVKELLGYEVSEVLGKTPFDFMLKEEEERIGKVFKEKLTNKGSFYKLENINRHKNGHLVVLETSGIPVFDEKSQWKGYRGIDRDITERKKAEQRLERLYKMNRDIIEKAPFGIYVLNSKGIVEYVNPAMLKISGDRYEDFMGLNMLELPSYEKYGIADKIREGLNGGYVKIGPVEYTSYIGKKTSIRNFFGIPMEEEGEKKLLIIVEDITEAKKGEKLKDEFISTVSHELRTPLSITKEGISLVLDGVSGEVNKKQKQILATAKRNIDRLAGIINELLDISKIESGRMTFERRMVDITDLIKQVIASFKPKAKGKGLQLKADLAKDEINVYADPDKIIQVLTNLVANAIRFTEKGYIEISAVEKKDFVECAVADTGVGILKDDLPRTFDRFRQFGRTAGAGEKGTGLGLSIAKGIVEMHNGKIWVASEPDKGSRFTFTLPKYDPEMLFRSFINNGIKRVSKTGDKLSAVVVSIDDFSRVENDLTAQKVHSLMKDMDKVLKSSLHQGSDVVFYGDGEIIVLVGCDRRGMMKIKARLEKVLGNYLDKVGLTDKIKLRFGTATYPDDGNNAELLLKKAREV